MTNWLLVATVVCALSAGFCAGCAVICLRAWHAVKDQPSTHSLRAEMIEIRDFVTKLDAWGKRINQRLIMAERRETAPDRDEPPPANDVASLKARLRQQAGLVPGKPAPHRE
jgi:hypothetical protein